MSGGDNELVEHDTEFASIVAILLLQCISTGSGKTLVCGLERAKYFREKAELCLRLADGLSLNNPGRFQLLDLADDFLERAKELEAQKEPLFALL